MKGFYTLQPAFDFPRIEPSLPTNHDRVVLITTWLGCSDVNPIDPPVISGTDIRVTRTVIHACGVPVEGAEMHDIIGTLPPGHYRLTYQEIFGTQPGPPIEPRYLEFTVRQTFGVPSLDVLGAATLVLAIAFAAWMRRRRARRGGG